MSWILIGLHQIVLGSPPHQLKHPQSLLTTSCIVTWQYIFDNYHLITSQDFYMSKTTPTLIYPLRMCQLSNVPCTPEISLSTHWQLLHSMPQVIFLVSRTCITNISNQQNHGTNVLSARIVFLLPTGMNYQVFEDFTLHKSASCL